MVLQAMPKLAKTHKECIALYDPHNGEDNKHRLTGKHETSSAETFSWGVANRAASVRIPRGVSLAGKVGMFRLFFLFAWYRYFFHTISNELLSGILGRPPSVVQLRSLPSHPDDCRIHLFETLNVY